MAPSRAAASAVAAALTRLAPRLPSSVGVRFRPAAAAVGFADVAGRRAFGSSRALRDEVEAPDFLDEGELHVFNKVKAALEPVRLNVQDISGGCGSMYGIEIESARFRGMTVIKQHKLVNEILKDEIKNWHGVQLRTKAAPA
ncbi:uncharacterized protein K452DRAFT_296471 [Aplosporella prunicola CBS 121167]|uniref:Bola-like protein n=1 Tax=Aplosporella prunicola CBS 121167 TaxID=1176127 RepID=A0A6A6BLI7_9PEZI|nr:uncharacterized protein K452DRAFT_296471 [Aplosporella prunicola CBS 121167]KAF2144263.1 hypothetical protein K452DRAFT_296471 [Aplosporella prunicola CBS 121167]